MPKKYSLPTFLGNKVSQESYQRWLQRKAQAHVKRDRLRGNSSASSEAYREAIHNAVIESDSLDAYTGEPLEWELISLYDNKESKNMGRDYKKKFALLPTVDHVDDGKGPANFRICSWRTNDAKNNLELPEFITLCKSVLKYQEATVGKQTNNLKINPRSWYAWQMIPGYIGERNVPYSSPIFVEKVVPENSENGILTLNFVNVLYAEGVQDFTLDLKVLKHSSDYLIADLLCGPEGPDRAVIISHIEFAWIERFCPELWYQHPPSSIGGAATGSVSIYLSEVFGLGKDKR